MTENAVVYYVSSKTNALVNKSINFGSKYAPGECKSLYGIEHDGTCISAAIAYYETLEAPPYKNLSILDSIQKLSGARSTLSYIRYQSSFSLLLTNAK